MVYLITLQGNDHVKSFTERERRNIIDSKVPTARGHGLVFREGMVPLNLFLWHLLRFKAPMDQTQQLK